LLSPGDSSNLADVYYSLVEDRAFTNGAVSLLLAHVMAHEVGHLLLGPKHSNRGIMCGWWSPNELTLIQTRRLGFSVTEAQRLQAAVVARLTRVDSLERPPAR